ncbi:hypothetical protein B9Z19DRAFT_1095983, partial [Tuber borchii]
MLIKSLPILTLFLTLTHAAALANPFTGIDTSDLAKRACTSSCSCDPSASPGLYCGYCWAVTSCLSGDCFNDVYQCGTGGNCYCFGRRDSCVARDGP